MSMAMKNEQRTSQSTLNEQWSQFKLTVTPHEIKNQLAVALNTIIKWEKNQLSAILRLSCYLRSLRVYFAMCIREEKNSVCFFYKKKKYGNKVAVMNL